MSNPLGAYVSSVLEVMQNNAGERAAASREALVQANTRLIDAQTENEMASAKLAVAEAVNRAIRENPQIALQIGVIQLANSGLLGSTSAPASRQIGSSGASSYAEPDYKSILGGGDY